MCRVLCSSPSATQVLAAANPHYGRYNVRKSISENINLPVALLSRFDLLFLLRDIANHDLDLQLAIHVCSVHQFLRIPDRQPGESRVAETKALKQHIAQARNVQPVVPQELTEYVVFQSLLEDVARHFSARSYGALNGCSRCYDTGT